MSTLPQPPHDRAHDIFRQTQRQPLDAIFLPRTIAVIGATEASGSVGSAVWKNLEAFAGTVYPVNPKHSRVFDVRAFPNVAAVPGTIDLAVIVTPASTVPGVFRECVQAGVRGAIVISAGFKE